MLSIANVLVRQMGSSGDGRCRCRILFRHDCKQYASLFLSKRKVGKTKTLQWIKGELFFCMSRQAYYGMDAETMADLGKMTCIS